MSLWAGIVRLDDQIFLNRNPGVPSVVKFHPFTPCVAVADKDSIWYAGHCVPSVEATRREPPGRSQWQGLRTHREVCGVVVEASGASTRRPRGAMV